jgi:putative FmdB family regulatory protein
VLSGARRKGAGTVVRLRRCPVADRLAFRLVPIYEYRCPNGHTFEVFQRMSDPPAETCVTCGEGPVEKLLFPVAVHFKGSGFYSTDYGRGKKKPRESESSSARDTSSAPAKASSEAKPKPSAD